MKKVLSGSILIMAALLVTVVFAADRRDFTIINSTGYPIKFIGVNPPGDEIWDENEITGILEDKANFRVEFDSAEKGCTWNIKVTWGDDNTSAIYRNINLCNINTITLKYNRKTDTASYTTD
jgi:hypothetical protein